MIHSDSMNYRHAAIAQPRLRHFAPTLVMGAFGLYFAFYMLFGPHGYLALQRLQGRQMTAEHEFNLLKTKREALDGDVKLMRPSSLDRDMADEQTRRVLGYAQQDEVVIDLK